MPATKLSTICPGTGALHSKSTGPLVDCPECGQPVKLRAGRVCRHDAPPTTAEATGCPCDFYENDRETHDRLLGLETMDPIEALVLVAQLLAGDLCFCGIDGDGSSSLFADCADFGRFVAQHNWQAPAEMFLLASHIDVAADAAWHGARAMENQRHRGGAPRSDFDRLEAEVRDLRSRLEGMGEKVETKEIVVSNGGAAGVYLSAGEGTAGLTVEAGDEDATMVSLTAAPGLAQAFVQAGTEGIQECMTARARKGDDAG